jgi:hypothetical protein
MKEEEIANGLNGGGSRSWLASKNKWRNESEENEITRCKIKSKSASKKTSKEKRKRQQRRRRVAASGSIAALSGSSGDGVCRRREKAAERYFQRRGGSARWHMAWYVSATSNDNLYRFGANQPKMLSAIGVKESESNG